LARTFLLMYDSNRYVFHYCNLFIYLWENVPIVIQSTNIIGRVFPLFLLHYIERCFPPQHNLSKAIWFTYLHIIQIVNYSLWNTNSRTDITTRNTRSTTPTCLYFRAKRCGISTVIKLWHIYVLSKDL
jgi:hypothetical protein